MQTTKIRRQYLSKIVFIIILLFLIPSAHGAGVTIITHGWGLTEQETDDIKWIVNMRRAISKSDVYYLNNEENYGEIKIPLPPLQSLSDSPASAQYRDPLVAEIVGLPSNLNASSTGEIVILLNWSPVSNHFISHPYNTGEVAKAVSNLILNLWVGSIPLVALPIHLVGHSRGGTVMTELAKYLGEAGVWVDHITTLDPHPVLSTVNDPNPQVYENVVFADNYYQGSLNRWPDGRWVDGAYNRYLEQSVLDGVGYEEKVCWLLDQVAFPFCWSENHADVPLWYHGTIDLGENVSNGAPEITITPTMRSTWWTANENYGIKAGYRFSRIGSEQYGNLRNTDFQPVSGGQQVKAGYNALLHGGSQIPIAINKSNAVWPNILDIKLLDQSSKEFTDNVPVLKIGEPFRIEFYYSSYNNNWNAEFYLDNDRNPYNGLGNVIATASGGTSIYANLFSIPATATNISSGVYYICGKITAGNKTRYLYATPPVIFQTLSPPYATFSTPSVSPFGGNVNETFTYRVAYSDTSGISPLETKVYIDGVAYNMTLESGTSANGTYKYIKSGFLDGLHNYRFVFKTAAGDFLLSPSSGTHDGPIVSVDPGNDFTIDATSWTDDHTNTGNKNGFPEGGEDDIDLTIKLKNNSNAEISNVEATLTTTIGDLTITDSYNYYGAMLSHDATWGDGKFRMNLGFDQYWGCPFKLIVTYTKNGSHYTQNIPFKRDFPRQGESNPIFEVDHTTVKDTIAESARNNNDGTFQSGEDITFDIYLKNIGNAIAVDVKAKVSNVRGDDGTIFEVPVDYWRNFQNLVAGGGAAKQDSIDFIDIYAKEDFAGIIRGDITVKYGSGGIEQVIHDQVLFNVQPESWLIVTPINYDFKVSRTDKDVTTMVVIKNCGSAPMSVTAISTSNADTTWTGEPLPWTLLPGGSKSIDIQIATTNLNGKITREVFVASTGRVHNVGVDDRIVISGTVSNSLPFYEISGIVNGAETDISGDWIVYRDYRNVNWDIYAYQISTGTERRITSNSGYQGIPFISGNLIVWEDMRNWDGQSNLAYQGIDIYGYDLSAEQEFVVSNDPMTEWLIGVDGNRIIFTRTYDVLYNSNGTVFNYPRNLLVYEYLGNGEVTQRYSTGWTASGHQSHQTIRNGDFNNDLLVVNCQEWFWKVETSDSYWDQRDQHSEKINFAAGDTGLVRVAGNSYSDPLSAASNRFAYVKEINDRYQLMLWNNGSIQQITTGDNDIDNDFLATSENFVVYGKKGISGMFYADLLNQNKEGLVIDTGDCSEVRMDGNTVVWKHLEGGITSIRYAYLGADISVSTEDIKLSIDVPYENMAFYVIATVRNKSSWSLTGNITIDLYDGDPKTGGSKIGTQTIVGGIQAQDQYTVTFNDILLPKGSHMIFVKCSEIDGEYKPNNIASKSVTVRSLYDPGDIDGSRTVNLTDAILALQILAGIVPSQPIFVGADVNEDNKIGLAEALYILQKVAGMR